mgnify:FL=1|tara:strand:+ start:11291 stop:11479 length:189 start_codon:yes stop_codon:yes gene_type:complete
MADVIDFIENLQKEINTKLKDIEETLMSGNLKDMEHYKYLQGQLNALYNMQDFIKNYFDKNE